jgi:hypothetical protein
MNRWKRKLAAVLLAINLARKFHGGKVLKFGAGLSCVTGLLLIALALFPSGAAHLIRQLNPFCPLVIGIGLLLAAILFLWPGSENWGKRKR